MAECWQVTIVTLRISVGCGVTMSLDHQLSTVLTHHFRLGHPPIECHNDTVWVWFMLVLYCSLDVACVARCVVMHMHERWLYKAWVLTSHHPHCSTAAVWITLVELLTLFSYTRSPSTMVDINLSNPAPWNADALVGPECTSIDLRTIRINPWNTATSLFRKADTSYGPRTHTNSPLWQTLCQKICRFAG